jgi:hypothetical protein
MATQRTTERVETYAREVEPGPAPVVEAEESHVVATDPYDRRRDSAWRVGQLVFLVFGVAIALIAIRFVLLLLGANPEAGFADFVYSVTNPLVAPFEGIFGAPDLETGVFDPASLVAIVVYALLGWVVGKVIDITLGETRTGVSATTREHDTHVR